MANLNRRPIKHPKQPTGNTFVGPDAAVVRFFSTLTGDERAPDKVIRSRKVLIVNKREGKWKIGWGQNTRLADTTPD